MAAPKYKLIYFNIFGLAEPIRWMFAYSGIPFEDYRIPELPYYVSDAPKPEWEALKDKTPFGTVPILELDGKYLGETLAIARYLAAPLNLAGKTDWETAQADSIVTYLQSEYMVPFMQFMREMDKDRKVMAKEKLNSRIAGMAKNLEKILQKNTAGKGFFIGDSVIFADFFVVMFYDLIDGFINPGAMVEYPLLTAHRELIRGLPGVKEFIQKHSHLKF